MNRNGKKNKNYAELIKEFIKNNKKASICTMAIILVVLAKAGRYKCCSGHNNWYNE